jgi:hypothetical protein
MEQDQGSNQDQIVLDLQNNDCIIIGSPDVSDYAEYAWAKIHRVRPWRSTPRKLQGFVLLKKRRSGSLTSSIYREPEPGKAEGVALLNPTNGEIQDPFEVTEDGGGGKTYGILVLSPNPVDRQRHIMILSGFTGIATNAVAQFLIHTDYKEQLHHLNQKVDLDRSVEVLLEVTYVNGNDHSLREDRSIKSVKYETHAYIG